MTTAPSSPADPVRILGLCGSLRKGSFNAALLRAAAELLPEGATLTVADLAPIPMYNQDLEAAGFPEPVQALRRSIADANAILIATPEYNFSIPAVLKNAIDWASRGADQPLAGKPAAIMGASPGMLGTGRSQMHLRQVMVFVDCHPINKPEVLVARAHEKIDAEGRVTDERTRQGIRSLLEALVAWTKRLQGR